MRQVSVRLLQALQLMPRRSAVHSSNRMSATDCVDGNRGLQTQSHYEAHSAATYEDAYFYEPGAYMEHIRRLVKERLGLHQPPSDRLILDLGGGTGNFTAMIVDGTDAKAIVIDPFLADESHNDDKSDNEQLRFVRAAAEAFQTPVGEDCWWRQGYNQVLLKEVVHHIDEGNRVAIFRGIYQGLVALENLPSLLIITRPQVEIDYPLWPEAKVVWSENQPSAETLIEEMKQAGLTSVVASVEAYPCSIPLHRWQRMVKQRFWSTFSSFTDDELDAACKWIEESERPRMDEQGCLHFEDRLLFLTATK